MVVFGLFCGGLVLFFCLHCIVILLSVSRHCSHVNAFPICLFSFKVLSRHCKLCKRLFLSVCFRSRFFRVTASYANAHCCLLCCFRSQHLFVSTESPPSHSCPDASPTSSRLNTHPAWLEKYASLVRETYCQG
ncbi:hypothetical protein DER45DRAFT_575136 [Fusarium avenaceum]|nr:hypothetical protein DER45DRAFT_575136 [Fusarium avenaceum]